MYFSIESHEHPSGDAEAAVEAFCCGKKKRSEIEARLRDLQVSPHLVCTSYLPPSPVARKLAASTCFAATDNLPDAGSVTSSVTRLSRDVDNA